MWSVAGECNSETRCGRRTARDPVSRHSLLHDSDERQTRVNGRLVCERCHHFCNRPWYFRPCSSRGNHCQLRGGLGRPFCLARRAEPEPHCKKRSTIRPCTIGGRLVGLILGVIAEHVRQHLGVEDAARR